MVLSGMAMIIIGVWLTAQAIGGNLAGRIRSWASGATAGGGEGSSSSGSSTPSEPSGAAGTGGGGSRVK